MIGWAVAVEWLALWLALVVGFTVGWIASAEWSERHDRRTIGLRERARRDEWL